jgi:hypothetical protein
MSQTHVNRILVLDLRADRIGYAVFEASNRLLDYGASRFDSPGTAKARVSFLLRIFHPSVAVLRRVRSRSTRQNARWTCGLRIIRAELKRFAVPVKSVTERSLKQFFKEFGCRNKFEVAALLAQRYPELTWKLPRKRKAYEPEPWTMTYFDAISLGVVYIASTGKWRQPLGDLGTLSPAPHELA